MTSDWLLKLRPILELLYFASGIVLTIVAIYGLRQIALTKSIANKNARRESIKFAADRCQYYSEVCVPLTSALLTAYKKQNLTFFNDQKFRVEGGRVVDHNFNGAKIKACADGIPVIAQELSACLNSLETFAVPFVAGVADDELGFQVTGFSFCDTLEGLMIILFILLKGRNSHSFESCLKLYEVWHTRLEAEKMKPLIESMNEKIKAAEKAKFTPLEGS
jgi:hypothetical protein